jgi:hypothetical protein
MKRFITVLACLLIALMFLASCAPPDTALDSAPAPATAPPPSPAPSPPPSPALPDAAESADAEIFEPAPLEDVAGLLPILTPSQMGGRMLSYNVNLNLQTTDFVPGLRLLLDTVGRLGGHLEFEHIRGSDMRNPPRERSADYSFRVPSEHLNEFLVVVENNYNILERQIVPRDETATYRRADTRLDDLRAQEQRLITDLGRADLAAEDRLEIERELTRVQTQIADLSAQQFTIEFDVRYSFVWVTLHEVILVEDVEEEEKEEEEEEAEPTFSEVLDERIQRSMDAFVAFGQGLLLVFIALAPLLVTVIVLGVITLIIVRTVKKRRASKIPNSEVKTPEKDTTTSETEKNE